MKITRKRFTKIVLLMAMTFGMATIANAQTQPLPLTNAIDNKGTIHTVLDGSKLTTVDNGLTYLGGHIQLGGPLTLGTTTITTDGTHLLALMGLQSGLLGAKTDFLLTIDATGVMKSTLITDILNGATTNTLIYSGGQLSSKVNGVTSNLLNVLSGADNGLAVTATGIAELGGALTIPVTTISADASHILKLLVAGTGNIAADKILVTDGTTNEVKTISASSMVQGGYYKTLTPNLAQSSYPALGVSLSISKKVSVYRNGAKLLDTVDYTVGTDVITFTTTMANLVVTTDAIEVQWIQ